MRWLTDLGIGGAIGLFIGIVFAEWVSATTAAAYVLLVILSIILFSLMGKIIALLWRLGRRAGGNSGDPET